MKNIVNKKQLVTIIKRSGARNQEMESFTDDNHSPIVKNSKIEGIFEKKSKLIFLSPLVYIMSDTFKIKKIDPVSIQKLQKYQIKLILGIINKKFKKRFNFNINEISLSDLRWKTYIILKSVQCERSNKRIEEKNKFLFKFVFKKLRMNFEKNNLNSSDNSTDSNSFVKFYFENLCKIKNIDIWKFFGNNFEKISKPLNNDFYFFLFQSEKFYKDFFHYLINDLRNHYEELIIKKFDTFFYKYDRMLKKHLNMEIIMSKYSKSLKNNNRIKFPWNLNEIDDAIIHFQKHINKLLPTQYVL